VEAPRSTFNILLACPSEYWSTIERTVLRDAKLLTEDGHKVTLYCLQDSYLDSHAKPLGIELRYHPGKLSTSVLKWPKLFPLSTYIDQCEIDIVQCYDIHLLWPLSFILRKFDLVTCIFNHNVEIQKIYSHVWYKPLIRRIDTALLPSREMLEGVVGSLGIPAHKIDFCGLGVAEEQELPVSPLNGQERHFLENYKEDWILGCYVGAHETKLDFLLPVLHCLRVLVALRPEGLGVKLVLSSEKPWDQHLLSNDLGHYLVDAGLDQHVLFESKTPVKDLQPWVDVWVGVRSFEAIEDYMITALLAGKPVVMTRSTATMELLRRRIQLGHTYKRNDSRDLRNQLEKIFHSYDTYTLSIKRSRAELLEEFGVETYKQKLLEVYQKGQAKRSRFYRRKAL
jgi:glycosyltransferase involved in cell wall biosynthesis